jgi:hypothetical protein
MGGFHSEREVIAIKVDHIKVAHAVVVILRWLNDVGSARGQFGVHTINVLHKHADATVTWQPFGLVRREKVHSDFVTAQARIEYWLSILKSDREAERVAVMLDTLGYVADCEYGRGTHHRGTVFGHTALASRLTDYKLAAMSSYGPSRTSVEDRVGDPADAERPLDQGLPQ